MDLKDEAIRRITETAARVLKPKPTDQVPAAARVEGDGNVVGNGNVIVMVADAGPAANDPPMDDQTEAALDDLVNEVVFHESLKKGKPLRHGAVWVQVRKALDVGRRRLTVSEAARADRYLRGWLAKVAAVAPAPEHDEKWRKRRVAKILQAAQQNGHERRLDQLLAMRYSATVLLELGDDQLDEIFGIVSTWL